MTSDSSNAAAERLDVARSEETRASDALRAASGTSEHFHAAVQLRAAEDQVEARTAWLAWTELGDEKR
jgi:hypothetical protein